METGWTRLCLIALMMEAAGTSGTSGNLYQSTQHNNPEVSHLRSNGPENPKSHLRDPRTISWSCDGSLTLTACLPAGRRLRTQLVWNDPPSDLVTPGYSANPTSVSALNTLSCMLEQIALHVRGVFPSLASLQHSEKQAIIRLVPGIILQLAQW
jgi:hypothetical protein